MCYDIKASYEAQLKRAQRSGDKKAIAEIKQNLLPFTDLPLYHASGFSHPKLLIYTSDQPFKPEIALWGLIPEWTPDEKQAQSIWNKTLNARAETVFKKKSFKASALHKRGLLFIDGFFEYHHYKKKSFPFYIYNTSKEPIALACLWSEWLNKETAELIRSFTVITREANPFMAKIHNNPKLDEARMPLMVPENLEEEWLQNVSSQEELKNFILEIDSIIEDPLSSHTVGKLRGKNYVGNVESVTEPCLYKELKDMNIDTDEEPLTLF